MDCSVGLLKACTDNPRPKCNREICYFIMLLYISEKKRKLLLLNACIYLILHLLFGLDRQIHFNNTTLKQPIHCDV